MKIKCENEYDKPVIRRLETVINHSLSMDRFEDRDDQFGGREELLLWNIYNVCSRYEQLEHLVEECYETEVLAHPKDRDALLNLRWNDLNDCLKGLVGRFHRGEFAPDTSASEEKTAGRAAYLRRWRAKNKNKVRKYNEEYWERRIARKKEAQNEQR